MKRFIMAAFLCAAVAMPASGGIVYMDDFESYADGDLAGAWNPAGNWAGNTGSAEVDADSSIGGANLARLNRAPLSGFAFLNQDVINDPIGTLSFDMIIPAGTDGFIRLAAVGSGQNQFIDISTSDFTGPEVIEYTAAGSSIVHLDFVAESTPTGTATLYADGVSVATTGVIGAGTLTRFGMWANGGTVLVDNVVVRDEVFVTAAVPEPGSIALLGLAGLAGIARRKRA